MSHQYKKIAIKVGSNVLTRPDQTLNIERISHLVDQISELRNSGVEVILISSGAVAAGRGEVSPAKKMDPVSSRQLWSAIGQAKLINHYFDLFKEHGIICAQVLTTKDNFKDRQHYLNMKNCVTTLLENGVVPIVNENDTISVTELMFTDNDELSGLIASMMDCEALIILSNIDGIYNGDPSDPDSKVIPTIDSTVKDLSAYISAKKSNFGRGGMLTKCNIARKVSEHGVAVFIANGERPNILTNLLEDKDSVPNTHFVAHKGKTSHIKRWLAHSHSFAKGEVVVNDGAKQALHSEKASSLLFIGITKIEGTFKKGDIIRILDLEGNLLGLGKSHYDSEKAIEKAGHKNARPLVHYDYLYLL